MAMETFGFSQRDDRGCVGLEPSRRIPNYAGALHEVVHAQG
jgi:hypothetical protein